MTLVWSDPWLELHGGDCREVLAELPAESVHCVVTSPPYWGLRDYGTASWDGGDPACDHRRAFEPRELRPKGRCHGGFANMDAADEGARAYRDVCGKCGARRVDRQLGLERSPAEYVARLVEIMRAVWRVLRVDGTLWLNLGDSYASDGGLGGGPARRPGTLVHRDHAPVRPGPAQGLKVKDLVGVPWRVAFALQDDGWYLRRDVVWHKPNPMPESVEDRPTASHEFLFMLAKSGRPTYWTHRDLPGVRSAPPADHRWVNASTGEERSSAPEGWTPRSRAWRRVNLWRGRDYFYDADAVRVPYSPATESFQRMKAAWSPERTEEVVRSHAGTILGNPAPHSGLFMNGGARVNPSGRSLRSVWTIPTEPYDGAHFATFPRKLVEPCILAGTSARGVCATCGAPWTRVVELTPAYEAAKAEIRRSSGDAYSWKRAGFDAVHGRGTNPATLPPKNATTGWRPSCEHGGDPVPAVVLDPFAGSGTVGLVAEALGRRALLVDLSPEYAGLALERIAAGRRDGTGAPVDLALPAPADSLWALIEDAG